MNAHAEIPPPYTTIDIEAELPPLIPAELHANSCRRLVAAIVALAVSDAVTGGGSGLTAHARLRHVADARRFLSGFIERPEGKHDLGYLLDLIGLERSPVAEGLRRMREADWPADSPRLNPLCAYVSADGEWFYCPRPPEILSATEFLKRHPTPDIANPCRW